MIQIQDKSLCCGCSACASACPKHCITMEADHEGFLYPRVNVATCVECGLCEKVCHELHPQAVREPQQVLAAINKDESIRLKSSSGGIFYLLAEKVIHEGGVVFGARFDSDWQVVIDYAETLSGVEAFMGSKYVQARMEQAYIHARQFLKEGRKVLFAGTPCQIAGLHQFLRKDYENLLTVDFICHGTPSPKVWGMYLKEVVQKVNDIHSIRFRDKANGWKKFGFELQYDAEPGRVTLLYPFGENPYMNAFLTNITLRPSCYACKANAGRSGSDVTIADFWGVHTLFPTMDDDKGTGLVFLHSDKGKKLFENSKISSCETSYESIKPLNPSCYRSVAPHPKRSYFFRNLDKKNLFKLIEECNKPTLRQRLGVYRMKLIHQIIYIKKKVQFSGVKAG